MYGENPAAPALSIYPIAGSSTAWMKIIIGHNSMDPDCIGSMVLGRCLYPDHRPVKSRLMRPVARNIYNLYKSHLDFLSGADIRGRSIDSVVVVDTRSSGRIREFLDAADMSNAVFEVWDHHGAEPSDIPGAVVKSGACGANTTLLALEVMKRGIDIAPDDATIALTGIYADTGNFTHEDVAKDDFDAARFLLEKGGSLRLVRTFLAGLKEEYQIGLFHEVLSRLIYENMHGHSIVFCYKEMEVQAGGLAAVVEKIYEVESPDALFAVFGFRRDKSTVIIARSRGEEIMLDRLLAHFGGGGHPGAASAQVKNSTSIEVFQELRAYLAETLAPAVTAERIMSKEVRTMKEDWSLLEASMFLEGVNLTGAPVTDGSGRLTGFLTLRDIMKGRRSGHMHAPVKGYMAKKLVTGAPDATLREIQQLLFKNNVGHLPIVDRGKLQGIVTRTDYLKYLGSQGKEQ